MKVVFAAAHTLHTQRIDLETDAFVVCSPRPVAVTTIVAKRAANTNRRTVVMPRGRVRCAAIAKRAKREPQGRLRGEGGK